MILDFKLLIKKIFLKFGYRLQRVIPSQDIPISLWDDEKQFNDIYRKIAGHTCVDKVRCFMIYQYARQTATLAGDIAEVGVYQGGTAKLLAKVAAPHDKAVHIFDTFTGLPPSDSAKDIYKEGDFGDTSLGRVKGFLEDCKNIRIYKGVFPLEPNPVEDRKFCFAHIDADIYRSVMDCCEFFYPRIEKSGIMLFDDYGFPLCPGAKAAVDEFFNAKPEKVVYLPTGQCVVIKL